MLTAYKTTYTLDCTWFPHDRGILQPLLGCPIVDGGTSDFLRFPVVEYSCLAGAWVRRTSSNPTFMGVFESFSSTSAEPDSKYASVFRAAISDNSLNASFESAAPTYRIYAVFCFYNFGASRAADSVS